MIDRIEHLANVSVARACGFTALAIGTFFVGLSGEPALALKSAGCLSLIACGVLLLKAGFAARQPYRSTEVWLMLKPAERPDARVAQGVISEILREVYLRFAGQAALLAALFMTASVIADLAGR